MKTEKPADTASIERKKVGMLIPPPVLLLLTSMAAILVQELWLGGFRFSAATAFVGGIVAAAGFFLFALCAIRFRSAGVSPRPIAPPPVVVRSGPYEFSRNPMYLGMATLLGGLALALGSAAFFGAMLVFVLVVHFGVVRPEERYLETLHGEAYRHYRESVRRWL